MLTTEGRHLTFSKELLEVVQLFRRVGGETGPWQRVAEDRAVFMGFMRGPHGKSLTYQLSATLPPA